MDRSLSIKALGLVGGGEPIWKLLPGMTTIAGPWEPSLRLSCKTVRGGGLSGPGGGDGSGGNEGGPAILVMSTSRSRNSAVSRAPVQST